MNKNLKKRLLNPNKRTHRKIFVGTCEKLLNVTPTEDELGYIKKFKDRAKMEHVD